MCSKSAPASSTELAIIFAYERELASVLTVLALVHPGVLALSSNHSTTE